jgi:ABC-type nitrate/sulfonate/bicarbonate transport system permease component
MMMELPILKSMHNLIFEERDPARTRSSLRVRAKLPKSKRIVLALLFPASLLILWTALSLLNVLNPYFYPPPSKIFSALINLMRANHLIPGILASLGRILIATLASSLVSIPLGIKMASNEVWRGLFDPLVKLRYLPAFSLMPLLIFFVGVDEANKIIFLFLSITLYFLPSVIVAVDAVPDDLIDTARTLGASEKQVTMRVLIPASFPDIFQSFIIISGIGWNALMVAEIINARQGLGHIMNMARQRGQMDAVLLALIIIYLFAVLMDYGIKTGIKFAFPWKYRKSS